MRKTHPCGEVVQKRRTRKRGENVIFSRIAAYSGIALFEAAAEMIVGFSERIAAALLILPVTRFVGMLLGLGIFAPMAPGGAPSPMQFVTAVLFTGSNLAVWHVEKPRVVITLAHFHGSQAKA